VGKEISWILAAFASPAYFAADLTNGVGNTGSQAWKVPYEGTPRVPEPATLGLTSAGLLALFAMRKLRRLE
jgi:PEP-CTERM motif